MKISEFCINIRTKTRLSVLAFSKSRNTSHTYIQNVESGKYDESISPLALSNLCKVYGLTIDDFKDIDGVSNSEDFLNAFLSYYGSKTHGTKQVSDYYNIISMFKEKYLIPNNYIIKKENTVEQITAPSATHYKARYGMHCISPDNIDTYVYVLDVVSTIRSNNDVIKVTNSIDEIVLSVAMSNDFVKGTKDIILLTSSELVYENVKAHYSKLNGVNFTLYTCYCRPKRNIQELYRLNWV